VSGSSLTPSGRISNSHMLDVDADRGLRFVSAAVSRRIARRAIQVGLITQVWGKHWNWPKEIWR